MGGGEEPILAEDRGNAMQCTRSGILPNLNVVTKKRMEKALRETEISRARKNVVATCFPSLLLPARNEQLNSMTKCEFENGQPLPLLNGRNDLNLQSSLNESSITPYRLCRSTILQTGRQSRRTFDVYVHIRRRPSDSAFNSMLGNGHLLRLSFLSTCRKCHSGNTESIIGKS